MGAALLTLLYQFKETNLLSAMNETLGNEKLKAVLKKPA